MSRFSILTCCLALTPAACLAQDSSQFKSPAAKKAVATFQQRVEELDKKRATDMEKLRVRMMSDLEAGLKAAVEAKDFAEVQRISSFIESGDSPPKATGRTSASRLRTENDDLKRQLASLKAAMASRISDREFIRFVKGTSYQGIGKLSKTYQFADDGTLIRDGKPFGQWAVLGNRTVIGRSHDGGHIDVFLFSADGAALEVGYIGNLPNRSFSAKRVQ